MSEWRQPAGSERRENGAEEWSGVERSARQRGETACGIKDEIKKKKKVQKEGGVWDV